MQMQKQLAQDVKLHLGRSKSYLNKHEYLKSLVSLCEGLKSFTKGHFIGSEKIELSYRIEEIVNMVKSFPKLVPYLPEGLNYSRGEEKQLYKNMVTALHKIAEEIKNKESHSGHGADAELEKRRLLERMQKMLSVDDRKAAAGQLKEILQSFGDDPQIFADIAEAYYQAGKYRDAYNYALKAIKKDYRQMQGYKIAINACRCQKQYKLSESLYHQALKAFGEHANIYLNLSRLYREWEKPEQARQSLDKALELEPENSEALDLKQELQQESQDRQE